METKPTEMEFLLGSMLHGVLVATGVIREDAKLTGQELFLAGEAYMKSKGLVFTLTSEDEDMFLNEQSEVGGNA